MNEQEKKTTEDENLGLLIDIAIDDKARTLRVREVSRAYIRERSIHGARRRALRANYVNLLFITNWYVSVVRIVKKILKNTNFRIEE